MGASWFVQPDLVRLPLSDGQYLDVKRELTFGEYRRIQTDMMAGPMVQASRSSSTRRRSGSRGCSRTSSAGRWSTPTAGRCRSRGRDRAAPERARARDCRRDHRARRGAGPRPARAPGKPYWREWIESDLLIARAMHWKFEWVGELPREVYDVLVARLNNEADADHREI